MRELGEKVWRILTENVAVTRSSGVSGPGTLLKLRERKGTNVTWRAASRWRGRTTNFVSETSSCVDASRSVSAEDETGAGRSGWAVTERRWGKLAFQ